MYYTTLERDVLDSIVRMLNFYESQLDEIKTADSVLSLKMLKGIDEKYSNNAAIILKFSQILTINMENFYNNDLH